MYERATKKVVVDAGHGGSDPGALGNGLKEKDLTLQAARYMYNRLQELGIPAVITRDEDVTLERKDRINKILTAFGNSPDVIVVSNHINAGGGEGAEIVYSLRNNSTLADMAISNIAKEGQIARKTYQRRLPENPNKDYYFIMRETGQTEPILVEYGFIDTARDAKKLTTNLDNYVEGVVKAIADYANVPYTPPTTEENIYIVKKGDTLYNIAEQFNTTVNDIKRLNNLTTNTIVLGQKLLIEENNESPSNTTTYKVKKGDSLYKIAEEYNTTVNELKRLNNLTSNTLYIGQELKVPTSSTNGDNGTSDIISDEFEYYTVKKGDTIFMGNNEYY